MLDVNGRGEQRIDVAQADPAPIGVVDLDHGRDRARERAVQLFERDGAVGGRLAGADAELLLARGEQLESAVDSTADARADADDPLPRPREPQLGIMARDAPDLALRDAQ